MDISRKCIVKGRVQGVFFRVTTAEKANELGITGSAVNLPNGDVEVIARGSREAIDRFTSWLKQGPRLAEVSSVNCEAYDGDVGDEFKIG